MALGTLLFYISDMLVAKNQLAHWDDKWQKPIMALYWGSPVPHQRGAVGDIAALEKETIPGHRQQGRDMKEKTRRKLVWRSIFAQW